VPVTTVQRDVRLRVEKGEQSWTADKGWTSDLDIGRGANNYFDGIKPILLTINEL